MATAITHDIKISVSRAFQGVSMQTWPDIFQFAYQITIENFSDYQVQLLHRHWYIIDGQGQKREVEGEGVVGKQPLLMPGESHQYISGCHLTVDMGKMRGTYTFERKSDGKLFEVEIPEFELIAPYRSN